ncbi:hypothetical protein B0H14DRAFT_152852 [Mycena olivaceomarginata]|nr:hypothetical protein B0H14DRAFT_152852 [Mycena olivaceomarginata]
MDHTLYYCGSVFYGIRHGPQPYRVARKPPRCNTAVICTAVTVYVSTASKGKAPASASAPVEDVASSTAKVQAIDAVFTALANEFVFLQLDFSTRPRPLTTQRSPPRLQKTFVLTKLSYHTQNRPLRLYYQALSGLLARLDAARQQRKEIVVGGRRARWMRWRGAWRGGGGGASG